MYINFFIKTFKIQQESVYHLNFYPKYLILNDLFKVTKNSKKILKIK